ncbi:spore coat protein U domain-containing protein [Delftia acidovorans]|uniref:spore coat protein U domain-containing protein n=1 Tax=Delftia acidovorans TaxID=80866 RepID=UPI0024317983|nr:spore coat protein U domain-containing protein [Delftia acidovorans]
MKKSLISTITAVCMSLLTVQALAGTTNTATKTTATLAASCTISANSISFGMLMLPLTTQSASSTMSVLCNKGATYKIDLAYGGIYGSRGDSYMTFSAWESSGWVNVYNFYTSGVFAGRLECQWNGSTEWATGYSSQVPIKTCFNHAPTGWIGNPTTPGSQAIIKTYDYGMITGAGNGSQVAYSIEVPGDPSKVWNTGINSYDSTGIGVNQIIPIKASLVPGKTSSSYPAPDIYMDTVTATITY